MRTRDLVRRQPGQNGCCGCWFSGFLGLSGLALTGCWMVLRLVRRHA